MFSSNASQVSSDANFIEDVFSTYLYTGNGSTQTITNGIDLAGEGGLVWLKSRSAATNNFLFDTSRGVLNEMNSNNTEAQASLANSLTAFNANGFSLGSAAGINVNAATYASWTFRKQPKFFDVVTYTGNGANRTIAHNLGSVPGCIMVKRTDATANWQVYHRSLANTEYMVLNTTAAKATGATRWNSTTPTSTVFSLGTDATVNASGGTYVAYLFAHDSGGFGLTGEDNVISCGAYTGTGLTGNVINLGYEPQFVIVKSAAGGTSAFENWNMVDNMRGWAASNSEQLSPNLSAAETSENNIALNATGFELLTDSAAFNSGGNTYIYIAIRRGPMKVPESGTSVFTPVARTGTGTAVTVTGFQGPLDSLFVANRTDSTDKFLIANRLTAERYTLTSSTAAETVSVTAAFPVGVFGVMNGFNLPATTSNVTNKAATTYINYGFTRAPGFFDVVCYTGTGAGQVVSHNLTVVPELAITKRRNDIFNWVVTSAYFGNLNLNDTSAQSGTAWSFNGTPPTSTQFTTRATSNGGVNSAGNTYVLYLFATCPGVSKVTNFTGNGTSQTINCGFTSGARFVMIKATSTTGNWTVFDSARGISAGGDPALYLNSTAAEVTGVDAIDADSTGFIVNQEGTFNLNASGVQYLVLAIS